MTSATNLTGIWQGVYFYPRALAPMCFVATLIETASAITGSTHEPHRRTGSVLCAILAGSRAGARIHFLKSYEPEARGYASVRYEGTVTADGSEIEGCWIIDAAWSGRFLMIRGAREKEEIATRKFARA